MPQVPTQARRSRLPSGLDDVKLSDHVLAQSRPPRLGRPPKDEEEKKQVLTALCYLKSAGKTNRECASELDVSERTIVNYLAEPLYQEVQQTLVDRAKERGYATLGMLMDHALETLYQLMKGAGSEFVRFKAAETLLNYLDFDEPRVRAQTDSRDEVARFLSILAEREHVQVNVQVNTGSSGKGEKGSVVVEQEREEWPAVLPGGRLPASYPGASLGEAIAEVVPNTKPPE